MNLFIRITILFVLTNSLFGQNADTCSLSSNLLCGESLSIDVANNSFSSVVNDCYFVFEDKDVWIRIVGTGTPIEVLTDVFFGEIFAYTGSCASLECKYEFDFFINPPSIVVPTNLGQEYFFRIAFSQQIQTINVSANCLAPLPNDNCDGAQIIQLCEIFSGNSTLGVGQTDNVVCPVQRADVWYEIQGNGDIFDFDQLFEIGSLSASVFVGSCNNLQQIFRSDLLDSPSFNSFPTIDSTSYFVQISNNDFQLIARDSFELVLKNIVVAENDLCDNAIPITCNETITGDISTATEDNVPPCNVFTNEDLWYSIQGDDMGHRFTSISDGSLNFRILKGSTCNNNECLIGFELNFSGDERTFFAESGFTYFISVSYSFVSNGPEFSFLAECFETPENNFCNDAISFMCGDTILMSTDNATSDFPTNFDCSSGEGVWYRFVGQGDIHLLSTLPGATVSTNRFNILSGDCSNNCLLNETIRNNTQMESLFLLSQTWIIS